MPIQISNEVITELSLASISDDGRQITLGRPLDRKLYIATNKVLEELGGDWKRGPKAHVFADDVRPRLEIALSTGKITTAADLGFFETPPDLAERLVRMAEVGPGSFCLEPSAGRGAIVEPLRAAGGLVTMIEVDRDRFKHLRLRFADHEARAVNADFMTYEPEEPFDRVVMNPPFAKVLGADCIDHVMRAFGMLIPSGVLVSVLPSGINFREDRRHVAFRAWIKSHGGLVSDLPEGSFTTSKTEVNTCVLRVRRPA